MTDIVQDKCKVMKNMERRCFQAKKIIADPKVGVNALQSAHTDGQQDENQPQQGRSSKRETSAVSAPIVWQKSMGGMIRSHRRYGKTSAAWRMHFICQVVQGTP